MRLTNKLFAQHLGWTFKKHWQVQGKRVPHDTGAAAELQKIGIAVKDVQEVLAPEATERERVEIIGNRPKPIPENEDNPNWHNKVCHIYGNSNILLEGVPQAQLLTNTIEIKRLPKNIEESVNGMQLSSSVDRNVQNSILASHAYDAEQVKLPKIKIPERPAYNLPREYGISQERKHRLLINKLLLECEKLAGRSVNSRRRFVDQADFNVTLGRENDLLQFAISVEKMITSTRPLEPVKEKVDGELPDLHPIKCTITIPKRHIYTTDTFYPFSITLNCSHPHTIISNFNKETVGNMHGTNTTASQFQSRTLLKAFAVAASRAKQIYGESEQNLPKPIVVQTIQTDGRSFHFGVFQLNTLLLNGSDGLKNYWFHQPNMELYRECGYKTGRPILEGYNKDVFRCINAFYKNS